MESDDAPGQFAQLCPRTVAAARLAEALAAAVRDLIGADNQRFRVTFGDCRGLGGRKALGGRCRMFAFKRRFVGVRSTRLEGNLQAFQQFAAVGRGRGQNQ